MGPTLGRIAIDTSVLIDFLRDVTPQADIVERLVREDRDLYTAVSAYELRVGSGETKRDRMLTQLLRTDNTLPLDLAAAAEAGKVIEELRSRRSEIGPGDVLIAGICLVNSVPILTGDHNHFSRVPGLQVLTPDDFQ